MSFLTDIANELTNFANQQDRLIKRSLEDNDDQISDLVNSQMLKGEYGSGDKIKPEHRPFTKAYKQSKGLDPNIVALDDTGAHHKATFVKTGSKDFEADNRDPKSEALKDKYGGEIYDLQDANLDKVADIVFEDLRIEWNNLKQRI